MVTEEKYSGKFSCKVDGLVKAGTSGSATQYIPVDVWVPSYWYLRFRYKAVPDVPPTDEYYMVYIPRGLYIYLDNTGVWKAPSNVHDWITDITVNVKPLTGGWKEVTVKYRLTDWGVKAILANPEFSYLRFFCYYNIMEEVPIEYYKPIYFYIDDVYLNTAPPPPPAPPPTPMPPPAPPEIPWPLVGLAFLSGLLLILWLKRKEGGRRF